MDTSVKAKFTGKMWILKKFLAWQLGFKKTDGEILGIEQRGTQNITQLKSQRCIAIKSHVGIWEDKRD